MEKKLVITAGILGFLAVLLGAFGAHGLKAVLSENDLASFETGVRYQFYHTFLLLFVSVTPLVSQKFKKVLYYLILVGVIFFSGSIYLLVMDEILLGTSIRAIAFITPFGGLLLLLAWLLLFINVTKNLKSN